MEEFYGSGIVKEEQIQMEIRLLYGNEIQWAVQTAHEVYERLRCEAATIWGVGYRFKL